MAEDRREIDRVREAMRERENDDDPPAGDERDPTQLDDPVRKELRRRATRDED